MKDHWPPKPGTMAAMRAWPDAKLLEHCRWEAFRASGPGGQKRNKTSSAVRITHVPSGLSAIANESRSQAENRRRALRRLRVRMAAELRDSIDLSRALSPPWAAPASGDGALPVIGAGESRAAAKTPLTGVLPDFSARSEPFLPAAAFVLDVLAAAGWSLSVASAALGVTTSALAIFLQRDEKIWSEVNRQRGVAGLKLLGMKQ